MIVDKVWYAAIVKGHHAYAGTYDFPIRIKFVKSYSIKAGKDFNSPQFNVQEFIKAAKELEEEGVKAITCDCGLTGDLQEELVDAVDIPVFTSNLLIVPLALRIVKRGRKIGILTNDAEFLLRDNGRILRNCGIEPQCSGIVIRGMKQSEYREVWETQNQGIGEEEWKKWAFLPVGKIGEFNFQKVEEAIVSVAKKMVAENSDIGAIVLECTEMPLYAKAIRKETGLLVFDSVSLVKYIHAATIY